MTAGLTYTARIDEAFIKARHDRHLNLNEIKDEIKKNPEHFEDEFRNLENYVNEIRIENNKLRNRDNREEDFYKDQIEQ